MWRGLADLRRCLAGHRHAEEWAWLHANGEVPGRDESPLTGALEPKGSGGDLLSQGVTPQVPSALAGLTSVFGMGTGVTPPL